MKDKKIEKLIEKAAAGDQKAVSKLCEQKAREILYITTKIMKNVQDGEDAAQEVLIYMKDHIHKLQHYQAFNVWLYRIINGVCMNMFKKNKKMISSDLHSITKDIEEGYQIDARRLEEQRVEFLPYDFVELHDRRNVVFEVLDELPQRYRMCVYMYYFKEMNYKEISEALNITLKDVDNALTRGKKAIRNKIEKDPDMKKFLTRIPAVAPVPVLTKIIKRDFEEAVSAEAMKRVLFSAGESTAFLWGSMNVVRLFVGLGVLTGMITVVVIVNPGKKEEDRLVRPLAKTAVADYKESNLPGRKAEDNPDDQNIGIRSLEQMIGGREAERLRAFADSDSVNREEVLAFLDEIGMRICEGIWNPYRMQEHNLFVLEKENKLLMVILFHNVRTGRCRSVFRFTDIEEQKPENIEIMISYEKWALDKTYRGE